MGEDTYRRPSWDEYFLGLMDEVGKRATCDKAAADASWSGTSRSSVRAMLVLLRDFPIVMRWDI